MSSKKKNVMNVSQRSKYLVELALQQSDASDDDYCSDDSYVPDDDVLSYSSHDTDSEIEADDFQSIERSSYHESEHNVATESNDNENESESENESSDIGEVELDDGDVYYGKNKNFVWSSQEPDSHTKVRRSNIIKVKLSSLKGDSLNLNQNSSPDDVWRLFFDDQIITEIVMHTNSKLGIMRRKLKNIDNPSYKDTDFQEIEAFIGLMILCAIFKSGRENLQSLFSTDSFGRPIFRGVMSLKRCQVLLLALRFDDSSTRIERVKEDPAAAISFVFNKIISNCQKLYNIGAHACVDEALIPFRGRCLFRMFMPKKPAKYGIKLMCLTDAHNSYLLNSYIYVGKDSDGKTLPDEERKFGKPTQSVVRLAAPIVGTNRNITADNWFSSIELVTELGKRKLTYTGTLKKNKREIPKEFYPDKTREVGSSKYGYTKDMTLLSYVPKKSKAVILVSSMHHSKYTDMTNNKPEIISFYNATKSGVDTMDMKCANYSPNRRTRRWPLAIFYYLISMMCVNTEIIHKASKTASTLKRFDFMKLLATNLIKNHMTRRLHIPNLPSEIRKIIADIFPHHDQHAGRQIGQRTDKLDKRKACRYCPYEKHRMTNYKCIKCETPNCLECSKKLCNECVKKL